MSNRKKTPDLLAAMLDSATAPAATPSVDLLAAVSNPDARPRPRAVAPMAPAVWEYMTAVLRDYNGLRPRRINGQDLDNWKSQPALLDFLNIVGRYGWELVALVDLRRNEKEAYFKRAKS